MAKLVVDEVPELVQEAERDPAVAPRDAEVDRVAVTEPVTAALARGGGCAHGDGLEVGVEDVQRTRGRQRLGELRIDRAAPRQLHDLGQWARAWLPAPRDCRRLPPGLSAASAHELNLRAQPDAADTRQMRVVLLLLIPIFLFSAWQYTRREENENRLALVASEVALRTVDVSCPGFWARIVEITPYAGWVAFDEHGRPSDETSLSASTCSSLQQVWKGNQRSFRCLLARGCSRGTRDAVSGVVTLAHESWHLRGILDEARTQCYAVQTAEMVARSLGVAAEDARAIAVRVADDDARAPVGDYHSPECRPGGLYDLHPDTPDWPSG